MDQGAAIACPLCHSADNTLFCRDNSREYWRCRICLLVFVPEKQHLTAAQEKAIYDLHENQPDDPGYRQFLSRLAIPISTRLTKGAYGLDYGCGPGPALPSMLIEQGFEMELFDPIYARHTRLLNFRYDFITCTEVVEHFRNPIVEFERLFSILNPNGWLGIMTKQVINAEAFSCWHYKNDLTHISFFSKSTFSWLAASYHCRVEFVDIDVILFQLE